MCAAAQQKVCHGFELPYVFANPRTVTLFPAPEELSPPIIAMDRVSVGYGGKAVLSQMSLRIDQDDRIALLGRNGEGKSTLSKLLSGRLDAMSGELTRATSRRVLRPAPT